MNKQGNVLYCGDNSLIGDDTTINKNWAYPRYVLKGEQINNTTSILQNIKYISTGGSVLAGNEYNVFFIENDDVGGNILAYGQNSDGCLGIGTSVIQKSPKYVINQEREKITNVINVVSLNNKTMFHTKNKQILYSGNIDVTIINYCELLYEDVEFINNRTFVFSNGKIYKTADLSEIPNLNISNIQSPLYYLSDPEHYMYIDNNSSLVLFQVQSSYDSNPPLLDYTFNPPILRLN